MTVENLDSNIFNNEVPSHKESLITAINAEKGVIVVYNAEDISYDMIRLMEKKGIPSLDLNLNWDTIKSSKNIYFPSKIVGKAKCHPTDKWDEEYGKKLAKERYNEKYRKAMRKALSQLNKMLNDYSEKVNDFAQRFNEKAK